MPLRESDTSERDVVADLIAALEMYGGLFGSEATVIYSVAEGERDSVEVCLSDGSVYRLRVRRIR
jgi:hypothetical protein